MDPKTHHKFSFIPNRQILANKEILDLLVKSMVVEEAKFVVQADKNTK